MFIVTTSTSLHIYLPQNNFSLRYRMIYIGVTSREPNFHCTVTIHYHCTSFRWKLCHSRTQGLFLAFLVLNGFPVVIPQDELCHYYRLWFSVCEHTHTHGKY